MNKLLPWSSMLLSQSSLANFARLITGELGVKMPPCKLATVQNRLLKRIRHLGLKSFEEYEDFLFTNLEQEKTFFFDAMTTNKT